MTIEPRVLKGFRDFLPDTAARRKEIISILEKTFTSYGFQPIDTPALEYTEVLLGKGGGETDKQIYRFTDQGDRDISMRFDLTVPFARFMAAHEQELPIPFKRYHIDKVWRGENTQRGRYREFTQCDFDIVGTTALDADLEILLLIHASFQALGIEGLEIKINHRGIFNRFLRHLGINEQSEEIMRLIDKREKIGPEQVREELRELIGGEKAEKVLSYITPGDSYLQTLRGLSKLAGGEAEDTERMKQIYHVLEELSIEHSFTLDPSIMRGLDYYTGIVFETFFRRLPGIGSVCSGGRYDNLASLYTKAELPGVGSSIGLDRLIAALEELGMHKGEERAADLAVFRVEENLSGYYHDLARRFREEGLSVDVFTDHRKLGQQFKLAEKKHIPLALICGEDEYESGKVTLKNLQTRTSYELIHISEAINRAKTIIAGPATE
jgi:histidyl-tRNA synthetase